MKKNGKGKDLLERKDTEKERAGYKGTLSSYDNWGKRTVIPFY